MPQPATTQLAVPSTTGGRKTNKNNAPKEKRPAGTATVIQDLESESLSFISEMPVISKSVDLANELFKTAPSIQETNEIILAATKLFKDKRSLLQKEIENQN